MNILTLFRASTARPGGLPCVALTRPGTEEITSLVSRTRRVYTAHPSPDLLISAPTLTPGQGYSEHPQGLLLASGLTLHAERLAQLLQPETPFCVRSALLWAGLEEVTDDAGRINGEWYALNYVQNEENLTEIHVNTHKKRYTLLRHTREDRTALWTLDFTMLHELHAAQEPTCSDDPPSPHQQNTPTYASS